MNDTNKNTTPDLISTDGLDEMQREKAYKIAFNCFKAFYWSNVVISTLLVLGSILLDENPILAYTLSLVGIVITLLTSVIYVSFAKKTSCIGAMNPHFTSIASTPKRIITMSVMGFCYTVVHVCRYLDGDSLVYLLSGVFMSILYISHIVTYILARRNNKVLEDEAEE